MPNYPQTGELQPGYTYAPDPGGLAYNNARTSGTFTISADATTTKVDADVKLGDVVLLTANSSKGATMIAGGTNVTAGIYVSAVNGGSFTVTHDDHADAQDSTFNYVVFPSF